MSGKSRNPRGDTLLKLAGYMGLTPNEFLQSPDTHRNTIETTDSEYDEEVLAESIRDMMTANERTGYALDPDQMAELIILAYKHSLNKPREERKAIREGMHIARAAQLSRA